MKSSLVPMEERVKVRRVKRSEKRKRLTNNFSCALSRLPFAAYVAHLTTMQVTRH